MDELIINLPPSELKFIEDNKEEAIHYYNKVKQINQNDKEEIVRCVDARQRKFFHIFSYLFDLYNTVYKAREPDWSLSDPQCGCIYCRKEAGDFVKIHGVKISTKPLELNRIDIRQQRYFYNNYKMNEINKKIESGNDDDVPNWIIRKNYKLKKKQNIYNKLIY